MRIKLAYFLLLVISFFSCEDEPLGKWDDNILLSNDELTFSAAPGSESVTTGGEGWWLYEIRTDLGEYSNFEEIDVLDDNYTISRDDITVERIEKSTIKIDLSQNPTSSERTFYIVLQNGNYFDTIVITQEAA